MYRHLEKAKWLFNYSTMLQSGILIWHILSEKSRFFYMDLPKKYNKIYKAKYKIDQEPVW